MATESSPPKPLVELQRDNEAPDWDLVPFDVGCARCGHDLRALSEPCCPACELAFDWGDAVPVQRLECEFCAYQLYGLTETRCPECGEAFTWEEALERYRRSQKPLFEYHWRERPVRSFIKACSMAARPWKLWRLIEIHDPPLRGGLVVLLVLTALVLAVATPIIAVCAEFAIGQLERWAWNLSQAGWNVGIPGGRAGRWLMRYYTRPWRWNL